MIEKTEEGWVIIEPESIQAFVETHLKCSMPKVDIDRGIKTHGSVEMLHYNYRVSDPLHSYLIPRGNYGLEIDTKILLKSRETIHPSEIEVGVLKVYEVREFDSAFLKPYLVKVEVNGGGYTDYAGMGMVEDDAEKTIDDKSQMEDALEEVHEFLGHIDGRVGKEAYNHIVRIVEDALGIEREIVSDEDRPEEEASPGVYPHYVLVGGDGEDAREIFTEEFKKLTGHDFQAFMKESTNVSKDESARRWLFDGWVAYTNDFDQRWRVYRYDKTLEDQL